MKTDPGAAWFMQTKYGAAYWQASLPYRLGGHFARPHCPEEFGFGGF
jgi:hypothetical protein